MKIALCHSMQFSEKVREVEKWFTNQGHLAQGSKFINGFLGLNDIEKETLKLH